MSSTHFVLGTPIVSPWPDGLQTAVFGLGCFWGAERMFWQLDGVYITAVGYSGGTTKDPTYREVCNGHTMHAEV
ncbi:MAG: peptide-methionine (S)-S-oxide reductase, partial [Acidimicrobiaceae bacterium]|nr:peptide-methionine (S)-S-oxide reductase [Acidimicrobiaceae bacterium]